VTQRSPVFLDFGDNDQARAGSLGVATYSVVGVSVAACSQPR